MKKAIKPFMSDHLVLCLITYAALIIATAAYVLIKVRP